MTKLLVAEKVRRRTGLGRSLGTRGRRLVLAAASGGLVQAVSHLGTLLSFPLVFEALGETRFGVYALVTAVAAMLPFADFGIGLAVVTRLAQATGRNDLAEARHLVTCAIAILIGSAILLLALFGLLTQWVPWAGLLGVGSGAPAPEVEQAMTLLVLSVAIGLPGTLGYKILYAFQETHIANWWQVATVPLVVAAVATGGVLKADVAWFVASAIGIPSVVALCATIWVLGRRHSELRASLGLVTWRHTQSLVGHGAVIAFQSVTMAVGYQTDAMIVSHVLGVQDVALYSVSARVSALPMAFTSVLFFGLWPAFAEALARGDQNWTKRSLKRAETGAVAISIVFVLTMMLLGRPIISALSGSSLTPSTTLLLAVSAWTVVRTVHYPMAVLLNAAGVGRFLVWCGLAMAVVNLAVSIVLTRSIGVSGPLWGSAVSALICLVLPAAVYLRRWLNSPDGSPIPATPSMEA